MPQAATPNMALVQPTEDGDSGVWDSLLTTLFGLIDAHDHTTGKGVRIPSAALNINADVSWSSGGSNYAITDMKAVDFAPQAATAVTALASALFVNSSDANNLYFRNQSGTNVKLTDGATLNVSIVGGIGGDYSSISALLDYDDATDTYRFRQETSAGVRQYAKVAHADIKLFEYLAAGGAVVPTNAVTLKSPASLAAAYAVTFPAALAASQKLMQLDATGSVVLSGVLAANESITLSGTGYLKHGDESDFEPFNGDWYIDAGAPPSIGSGAGTPSRITVAASSRIYFWLRTGNSRRRIKSITVNMRAFTSATTLSVYLSTGIGTATISTTAQNLTGATTATTLDVAADGLWKPRTLTLTTPITADGGGLFLYVDTIVGGTAGLLTYKLNYDKP